MITNASPWDNLKFDVEGVKEVSRTFFGKLFQTYSFFAMYANVDDFDPTAPQVPMAERPEIDRWILSELHTLTEQVTTAYDDYEPTRAGRMIQAFVIDNLSNWHVRLSRKRFWGGEMDTDKLSAYQTLYTCLLTVSKLMAPIAPFYADRLYTDLTKGLEGVTASVHLAAFPKAGETVKTLERRMELAQRISSMVLSLRKKEHIIVRQPLQCITVPITDSCLRDDLDSVRQLILDEVNVKELRFADANMLEKKVKCNFRVMGKKFGKLMKAVNAAVTALGQDDINRLDSEGCINLMVEGQEIAVERADVEIISEDMPGWTVANEGTLTVALDLQITPELRNEGLAREVVKRIQNYRKESGFDITDRICVTIQDVPQLREAAEAFADFIAAQVLADRIDFAAVMPETAVVFDFEDFKATMDIRKS